MDSTLDYFLWLGGYLKKYTLLLSVAVLGMVVWSLSNGAIILFLRKVMGEALDGSLGGEFAVTIPSVPVVHPASTRWVLFEGDAHAIWWGICLVCLGILTLTILAEFTRLFVMKYVSLSVSRDLRDDLFENMIRRPVTFFEQRNVGDLISRLSSDIDRVNGSISSALKDIIQSPLELIVVGGIAVYVAPYLSLAFLVVPLSGYVIMKVGERIKRYSRASQDVLGQLITRMQERFSGIKLVKAHATENDEVRRFRDENQKFFRKMRRKILAGSAEKPFLHFMVYLVGIGVFYLGGDWIIRGSMPPEDFFTFAISLFWIYKPIRKIAGINDKIQGSRGAAERIDQVFSETGESFRDLPDGERRPDFREGFEFERVSHRYPQADTPALKEISLSVSRGERVAVVGPSGAGKSTLIDLLLRFFDPTSGVIRLDGHPLSEYRLREYRRLFGLVTQHTLLFDTSVTENIRYGRSDVSVEQVREAARQAEALPFIRDMPDGLDTLIGERGVRLSGGERQRLSLARALVRNPQILVLDEATSSVDSRSEQMILRAIDNLPEDMTLITISHALATVQFTGRIVVLKDGGVEAVGSHEQLLRESPTYAQLYEHQVEGIQTAFS